MGRVSATSNSWFVGMTDFLYKHVFGRIMRNFETFMNQMLTSEIIKIVIYSEISACDLK